MYAMLYKMYALFADAEHVPAALIELQSNSVAVETLAAIEHTVDAYLNRPEQRADDFKISAYVRLSKKNIFSDFSQNSAQ